MQITEFIQKTGFRPTEDYYHNVIEPEYMASKENDKDVWCKQWKKNGGIQKAYDWMVKDAANQASKAASLSSNVDYRVKELAELREKFEDCKEKLFKANELSETAMSDLNEHIENEAKMMETLIEISETYSASELRDLIIEKIGFKAYITYKLKHDKCIWALDREMIIENLK